MTNRLLYNSGLLWEKLYVRDVANVAFNFNSVVTVSADGGVCPRNLPPRNPNFTTCHRETKGYALDKTC